MSIPCPPPMRFRSEEERQRYLKESEERFAKARAEEAKRPYRSHWIDSPRIVSAFPLVIR